MVVSSVTKDQCLLFIWRLSTPKADSVLMKATGSVNASFTNGANVTSNVHRDSDPKHGIALHGKHDIQAVTRLCAHCVGTSLCKNTVVTVQRPTV